MALTQNEQLIIKHVAQNYLTKSSMSNIIPCQTFASGTEYASDWLTKDGETALVPIEGAFYFVTNVGNVYQWNRTERLYVQANLPNTLSAEDVTEMWG